MDDKLKIYELLYKAYADEIKNLWQRSVFLGTFMVLVWTGYGALQLKFITRDCAKFDIDLFHLVSLGLCAVIIVLSLLWVAMAKGSKFVQEAHEKHINKLTKNKSEVQDLFCQLDKYTKRKHHNLLFSNSLKAFRYSPSKINIALGQLSYCVGIILALCHIGFYIYYVWKNTIDIGIVFSIIHIVGFGILLALYIGCVAYIKYKLKGKKTKKI